MISFRGAGWEETRHDFLFAAGQIKSRQDMEFGSQKESCLVSAQPAPRKNHVLSPGRRPRLE